MLAKPFDSVERQTDFFVPNIGGFVVVEVNGYRKPLRIDCHPFFVGEKFPRPVNGFFFEVITKTKVAHHFEKRVMVGGAAHVFDVAGAEAFLSAGRASKFELDVSQKMILKRIHPGGGEQDRGIPFRNENITRTNGVPFGLKEVEIALAYFVGFHRIFFKRY